jgi:RimJ/RimL family protein N-acetyltransferase
MQEVSLVTVTDTVLSQLVEAAVHGAEPDDVTPPLDDDPQWTAGRVAWLRDYHLTRRDGLDGEHREKTYAIAVMANPERQTIAGAVRMARIGSDNRVLEIGIWLARPFRGQGIAATAIRLLLDDIDTNDLADVAIATTTSSNVGALTLLCTLGFSHSGIERNGVRAELRLR